LRNDNEEKHNDGRRPTDWPMRNSSEQLIRNVSSSSAFSYFSSSLSSICGDSIPSETLDDTNNFELVDEFEYYETRGNDEYVDSFENEFEEVVHEYARAIYNKPVSGIHKYLSCVIVPPGPNGVCRAIEELEGLVQKYPPQHWYIIVSHGDHIQISHICPTSNKSCRCIWLQRSVTWTKYGKRQLRRITRAHQLELIDYSNVLRYLSKAPRFVHRVGGFTEDVGLCDRYKYLSVRIKKLFTKTKIITTQ